MQLCDVYAVDDGLTMSKFQKDASSQSETELNPLFDPPFKDIVALFFMSPQLAYMH